MLRQLFLYRNVLCATCISIGEWGLQYARPSFLSILSRHTHTHISIRIFFFFRSLFGLPLNGNWNYANYLVFFGAISENPFCQFHNNAESYFIVIGLESLWLCRKRSRSVCVCAVRTLEPCSNTSIHHRVCTVQFRAANVVASAVLSSARIRTLLKLVWCRRLPCLTVGHMLMVYSIHFTSSSNGEN